MRWTKRGRYIINRHIKSEIKDFFLSKVVICVIISMSNRKTTTILTTLVNFILIVNFGCFVSKLMSVDFQRNKQIFLKNIFIKCQSIRKRIFTGKPTIGWFYLTSYETRDFSNVFIHFCPICLSHFLKNCGIFLHSSLVLVLTITQPDRKSLHRIINVLKTSQRKTWYKDYFFIQPLYRIKNRKKLVELRLIKSLTLLFWILFLL